MSMRALVPCSPLGCSLSCLLAAACANDASDPHADDEATGTPATGSADLDGSGPGSADDDGSGEATVDASGPSDDGTGDGSSDGTETGGPIGGCFGPGEVPGSVAPMGFALPSLDDERATYERWGLGWAPEAEPNVPAEPTFAVTDPDIHGDTEADDLWTYLAMHERTGEPGYLDRANAWRRYF